ncbi:hypothetical protein TARUN_4346 [Trichoderma arundinaceum]|uniref:SnoaL-like domain-containing protein n=1 Tax=Trichoderma arundinaceum TaxID=490622 RepID=A0A395NPF2_TRIAR|nr:hypothetical protein TARUN_4346 [Trichoderma arundinaceum]
MDVVQLIQMHFQTIKADPKAWFNLYSHDAILEMPYAPHPFPTTINGIDAIVAAVAEHISSLGDDFYAEVKKVYPVKDEDAAFVEFTMGGTVKLTGKKYEQDYISYFRAEDSKIVLYREYFDSARIAAAFTPGNQVV